MIRNALGFGSKQNIFAWAVAGSVAYYMYIYRPSKERLDEQEMVRRQLGRSTELPKEKN
jgi:hypothetical protein